MERERKSSYHNHKYQVRYAIVSHNDLIPLGSDCFELTQIMFDEVILDEVIADIVFYLNIYVAPLQGEPFRGAPKLI